MNKNIKLLLLSLSYTVTPALILSLGVGLVTGQYLSTFLVCFALVFILGLVSNSWISSRTQKYIALLEFKKIDLANQQSIEVTCTACKARNVVPVKLAKRNVFECSSCKKPNLIIFEFATATITDPLKLPQIGANTNG